MLRTAQLARQNTAQTWHPAIGLPVLASLSGPSFLDVSACQGETFGMEEQEKLNPRATECNRSTENPLGQGADALNCAQDRDGIIGEMPRLVTLGERIDWACGHDQQKDRSQRDLARAVGVGETTLIAWREPQYGERGMRKWEPLKRLALETGWSYEWLRSGKGEPKPLQDEERRRIEGELSATLEVQPAKAVTAEPFGQQNLMWPDGLAIDHELMGELLHFFEGWWKDQGGIEGSPVPLAAACQIYPQLHGGSIMDGRSKLQAFVKFLAIARK